LATFTRLLVHKYPGSMLAGVAYTLECQIWEFAKICDLLTSVDLIMNPIYIISIVIDRVDQDKDIDTLFTFLSPFNSELCQFICPLPPKWRFLEFDLFLVVTVQ
jgi:hypothetical protein